MEGNKCELCGMEYPLGGYDYWYVVVFKIRKEICDDCYKRLKKVE